MGTGIQGKRKKNSGAGAGPALREIPALVEATLPSVVHIETLKSGKRLGNGSGFVYGSHEGQTLLVTNAHVTEGGDGFSTEIGDSDIDAELVGTFEEVDISLLSVPGTDFQPLEMRDGEDEVLLGEPVIAIGSPLGHRHTVTHGIVSGIDRATRSFSKVPVTMIQTDAPINPGNSGGPLLGMDGKVVGVNTQTLERVGESPIAGWHFAVPALSVSLAVEAILRTDQKLVKRCVLGLPLDPDPCALEPDQRGELGQRFGARVSAEPKKGTPAQRAGFRSDDVIVSLGGYRVDDSADVYTWLLRPECLDDSACTLLRDGELVEVKIQAEEG